MENGVSLAQSLSQRLTFARLTTLYRTTQEVGVTLLSSILISLSLYFNASLNTELALSPSLTEGKIFFQSLYFYIKTNKKQRYSVFTPKH